MMQPEEQYKAFGKRMEETRVGWKDELKDIIGIINEKDIVGLTDMEERELLDERHLYYLENERKLKSGMNIADQDSCVLCIMKFNECFRV